MPKPANIIPDDKHDYGPAMAALSPRHRIFVEAYFSVGDGNQTEAARIAGYIDNKNGALPVTACRLMARPDVKAAMQEEARRRLVGMLPLAERAVREIVVAAEPKDRLKAAAMIMNRAGVHETIEKQINVNITMTKAEKEAEIRQMAEEMGMDPEKLLGSIVDAEFEEVPQGLEDVW